MHTSETPHVEAALLILHAIHHFMPDPQSAFPCNCWTLRLAYMDESTLGVSDAICALNQ